MSPCVQVPQQEVADLDAHISCTTAPGQDNVKDVSFPFTQQSVNIVGQMIAGINQYRTHHHVDQEDDVVIMTPYKLTVDYHHTDGRIEIDVVCEDVQPNEIHVDYMLECVLLELTELHRLLRKIY